MKSFFKLNRLHIMSILLSAMLSTQNALAIKTPRDLVTDSRIKVVAFQRDNVVPIHATTFTTTQIVFGKHELIENIQSGDLDAWTVSVQKGLPNMMFLKPTILGSNTNMTVVTNRYTYYFHLMSNTTQVNNQNHSTYAIEFIYPEQSQAKMLANMHYNKSQRRAMLSAHQHPKRYNWDYSFNGAHSITPVHIFDDGRFTYMQLQAEQAIPAIFAVNNRSGKESVVNYRRDGQYIVVQQISPQFTLREGAQHVASIFNNKLIHKLHLRGEA